jgi:hypothetical protein
VTARPMPAGGCGWFIPGRDLQSSKHPLSLSLAWVERKLATCCDSYLCFVRLFATLSNTAEASPDVTLVPLLGSSHEPG